MQRFLRRPNLDMYAGVKVTKETELEYKTENLEQRVKDLKFYSKTIVEGENYKSVNRTIIDLEEGDVILFESEERGYVVPVEDFVTIEEAIKDYENIKGLDGEGTGFTIPEYRMCKADKAIERYELLKGYGWKMFQINEDKSIYITCGDVAIIEVTAQTDGEEYTFQAGDVLRLKVFKRKDCEEVMLQKDVAVEEETTTVNIYLKSVKQLSLRR